MRRVLLTGGGAQSEAIRQIAPAVFARPVSVPPPGEYVADGAARQAAWVLTGGEEPPGWGSAESKVYESEPTLDVRTRYAEAREHVLDRLKS